MHGLNSIKKNISIELEVFYLVRNSFIKKKLKFITKYTSKFQTYNQDKNTNTCTKDNIPVSYTLKHLYSTYSNFPKQIPYNV